MELDNNDSLNIRQELEKYLLYWKWFLFSVFLSFIIGYIYLRYTAPQYTANTTILIKDNQKSGISDELKAVSDLGIVGTGSTNNTDNEIEIIRSRRIIGNVVDSLELDITYHNGGRLIFSELYNKSPIKIQFRKRNLEFIKDTVFVISFINEKEFEIKNSNNKKLFKFGELISSRIGDFTVENRKFNYTIKNDIFIKIRKKSKIVSEYRKKLKISPLGKNTSVLNLALNDLVQQKAEDFLNELVKQYNLDAVFDKNEVSEKTKKFIDGRLLKVYQELASIQDKIKDFKTKNNVLGLSSEAELILASSSTNNEKLVVLKTQLNLANGVYENLISSEYETLPTNLGLRDDNISQTIINFNYLVSEKNRLVYNAGSKNPRLIKINKEIKLRKENLISSIKNSISSINTEIDQIKKEELIINKKKSSIPKFERNFIDIAREQAIISELYSYLLKKKEETAISLAITVPNAKIIDVAYSSGLQISPKKSVVYSAVFLLGFIIPFIIIYLRYMLDNNVHTRKDIEELTNTPYLGDIPKSETNEKIIIGNESRTSTAEAFRLIRTNLDFMLAGNTKTSKFIFVTSTTSGEGKSFISLNLAAALALSGKRVLLIGMDLRAPKVTEYLGLKSRRGVTNYITNKNLSLDDIKFNIENIKNLDIISSGVIPPNPAELLVSKSVENFFTEVKNYYYYDYVIVDTAPVNLVTDTLLIAKYADMFLYVVRANYIDKRFMAVPEQLYKDKKLPNMAIVLNDTDPKRGYGYSYGGYGYGYLSQQKKPWYKKIFN